MTKLSIQYQNEDLFAHGLCDTNLYSRFYRQYRSTASGIELYYFDFECCKSHLLDSEYATPGYKIALCTEGFSENNSPGKEKYYFETNKILFYKIREGRSQSLIKGPGTVKILHLYLPEAFVPENDFHTGENFVSTSLSPSIVQRAMELLALPYQTVTEKMQAEYRLFDLLASIVKPMDLPAKQNRSNIADARDFLDSAPGKLIRIKELAKIAGINEYRLKKEFKMLTGKGVFEYQQERLMKEAYDLLREGMSVAEVAEKTGYSSAGNFSNAFYKTFGFRPGFSKKS